MSALEGHAPDPVQMLHSTGIAAVWLDTQLKVRGFTPAARDLLEIAATDVGRPVSHLPRKFTDGELMENATRVMASAVPIDAEVRSHSGRDYLWRTLPDLTRDQRILGAVITFTDISNRRQMESALQRELQNAQRLRVSAEAANRAMDEFIATVSHDLRTPLNTIRLWSRMFASGKVPEQTLLEGARMIGRAAAAQQQLIDDLVDLASLVCGRLRLEPCDTQLSDVIAGAVGMLRPLADSRGIALQSQLHDEIGPLRCDPGRIQQVLYNLLANVLKLTPDGGQVHVRFARRDDFAHIELSDSGPGIPADLLPYLFDGLQGDAGHRRNAGAGLGLALAQQLTRLHGGSVTARSNAGSPGTTITMSLPLPLAERAEPR
jgi:two-component system CheB/CheR fusion protein